MGNEDFTTNRDGNGSNTRSRIVKLLQSHLNYFYLGNWKTGGAKSSIDVDLLTRFLKNNDYSDETIDKVLIELNRIIENKELTLFDLNMAFYLLLRDGVKIKDESGENYQTIYLINWNHPLNNDYSVAEEVIVKGEENKSFDVVIYLNGIALCILELSKSITSLSEGIKRNLENQKPDAIRQFFVTVQLIMAGNNAEGLRYGVIGTVENHYLKWREDSEVVNPLDKDILLLFRKGRLLEIIYDFISFDKGQKKICRYHQFFGVKAAQDYIKRGEGGIIWHTKGTGKNYTMSWLAKWIKENYADSKVIVFAHDKEHVEKIKKVFTSIGERIELAINIKDLVSKLDDESAWLVVSLIKPPSEDNVNEYLEEIKEELLGKFKPKGNIYVFMDGCHNEFAGRLYPLIKKVLPDVPIIGFTDMPFLKKDKSVLKVFGRYIHSYKFHEAVRDNVILDLKYESRNLERYVNIPGKGSKWFDTKTKNITEIAQNELRKKYEKLQFVIGLQSRYEKIVADIIVDMETKGRLKCGLGNAVLIAEDIEQAHIFYELFKTAGFTKCAVVASSKDFHFEKEKETEGSKTISSGRNGNDTLLKTHVNKETDRSPEEVVRKFVEEPDEMKLLITDDEILRSFDAPSATYLYIDKTLFNHSLYYSVCWLNKHGNKGKQFGHVVDYKNLFSSEKTTEYYTGGALFGYDSLDVKGLLKNYLIKGKENLDEALNNIRVFFEAIDKPMDTFSNLKYFCGKADDDEYIVQNNIMRRKALYDYTASLIKAYAEVAAELDEAGYSSGEILSIKNDIKYYETIRTEVRLVSCDYFEQKVYEPEIGLLTELYVDAEESMKVSNFDNLYLVQLLSVKGVDGLRLLPLDLLRNTDALSETIENNLRQFIADKMHENPDYYKKMIYILKALIAERKTETEKYEKYLSKIMDLCKLVLSPGEI